MRYLITLMLLCHTAGVVLCSSRPVIACNPDWQVKSGFSGGDMQMDIVTATDKKDMVNKVAKALGQHKSMITICCLKMNESDGCKDYRKSGCDLHDRAYTEKLCSRLWDELQKKDGYHTGIVTGHCINAWTDEETGMCCFTFQFNYMTTEKQERYIDRRIKRIVKRFKGRNRYECVKKAHDYLTNTISYDESRCNPYYALKEGKGICMSYALVFQRIMQEMHIPCVYVKGRNHAWNMVKLKSCWYIVDVTWDDSSVSRTYFLKGEDALHRRLLYRNSYVNGLRISKKAYE